MYISALFLGYAATLASAGCFSSGETWGGDWSAALAAAQTACSDGRLNIGYSRGQTATACINLSTIKKVDFTISADLTVLEGDKIPLDSNSDICTSLLHAEINGCEHGGHSGPHEMRDDKIVHNYGNLYVTSDPNEGNC